MSITAASSRLPLNWNGLSVISPSPSMTALTSAVAYQIYRRRLESTYTPSRARVVSGPGWFQHQVAVGLEQPADDRQLQDIGVHPPFQRLVHSEIQMPFGEVVEVEIRFEPGVDVDEALDEFH